MGLIAVAGVVLGVASLVKMTAVLIAPGVLALGWAVDDTRWSDRARTALAFLVPAAVVQLPWELWQWAVLGSPFPTWAGKPSPALVANNPYVRYLTAERSPLFYVKIVPLVMWTLVPSFVMLGLQRTEKRLRGVGLTLVGWIGLVVAVHVGLGAIGYSKVLRYVILIVPAAVLLFAATFSVLWQRRAPGGRLIAMVLVTAMVLCALEVSAGVKTALYDRADHRPALVRALSGSR